MLLRVMRWLPWAAQPRPPIELARPLDVTAVHAAHADFVWASLQRLGVHDADLEDLAQEVFLIVHERLSTFDASRPMPPWLFGICRRVAATHRRKAHVRRETATFDAGEDEHDTGLDPEQTAAARQARDMLDAVLDGIEPDKRVVLVMFEIDELPCEAIAEALGIPVGTVYSRLHAARKAFERSLARVSARAGRGGIR